MTSVLHSALCFVRKPAFSLLLVFLFLFPIFSIGSETVAISYFDNTSHIPEFDPISKGISDMLITDLSKVSGITIVERSRLEDLLKEIELNKSKYFDKETAQKLGKGLGAKSILTGAFIVLNNDLRMDARLVDVQSGKITMAESVNCSKDDFFKGYKQLVELITKQFNVKYSSATSLAPSNQKIDLQAVMQYSKAIDFADKGFADDASTLLASTVKSYPGFAFASNKLEQLKAWMKEIDKQREQQMAEETRKLIESINVSDPQFGQQVNKIWTNLLTSWHYSSILSFNKELRTKGISDELKLFGETSPITFGEMYYYYEALSWNSLKDQSRTIEAGKLFLEKFPSSMYYSSIKMFMEQSIEALEKKEKGKETINEDLARSEIEVYVDFFNGYKFRKMLEVMNNDEYSNFKSLFTSRILNAEEAILKSMIADNTISISDLFAFRNAAERFNDPALLDLITAKNRSFGDESVRVEEQVLQNKEDIEKHRKLLEESKAKIQTGTLKDAEQVLRNARTLKETMDFEFIEKAMRTYLQLTEKAERPDYRYDAWENLIFSLQARGREEEAGKELKNYQEDKTLRALDSMRLKKEILSFKNEYAETGKVVRMDKTAELQVQVYTKKADAYADHFQYTDEAAARMHMLNDLPLPPEQEELQIYKLLYAYYNLGRFTDARKTADQLKSKFPKGSFVQASESLVKFMPQ